METSSQGIYSPAFPARFTLLRTVVPLKSDEPAKLGSNVMVTLHGFIQALRSFSVREFRVTNTGED